MSIVGVMLGVAVLIVVLAVMTGFTNEMKMKMCETMAHIQIHDYRNGFIAKPEAISEKVNAMAAMSPPLSSCVPGFSRRTGDWYRNRLSA